jgi:hypothetical protein
MLSQFRYFPPIKYGFEVILSLSFPKATSEPVNVSTPIKMPR